MNTEFQHLNLEVKRLQSAIADLNATKEHLAFSVDVEKKKTEAIIFLETKKREAAMAAYLLDIKTNEKHILFLEKQQAALKAENRRLKHENNSLSARIKDKKLILAGQLESIENLLNA